MIQEILLTSLGIIGATTVWCLLYFGSLYLVSKTLEHYDRLGCDTYLFSAGVLFIIWSIPVIVTLYKLGLWTR